MNKLINKKPNDIKLNNKVKKIKSLKKEKFIRGTQFNRKSFNSKQL